MNKMRTIDGLLEEIKKDDPDTALTRWAIRGMIIRGEVPSVMVGTNKRLIDLDVFKEHLKGQN